MPQISGRPTYRLDTQPQGFSSASLRIIGKLVSETLDFYPFFRIIKPIYPLSVFRLFRILSSSHHEIKMAMTPLTPPPFQFVRAFAAARLF